MKHLFWVFGFTFGYMSGNFLYHGYYVLTLIFAAASASAFYHYHKPTKK